MSADLTRGKILNLPLQLMRKTDWLLKSSSLCFRESRCPIKGDDLSQLEQDSVVLLLTIMQSRSAALVCATW
ncbi:hypothetical protein Nepgr_008557 [Nepenthes gracilis]|uniref:Uncharacterized protein n=1 Tax=Nepenthes gracilis TaxID=150966 RepID=A0AAD3XJC5_NEPGR|nr:hypothetical protein Nepgr_008557 [Nepenthes gracilis]